MLIKRKKLTHIKQVQAVIPQEVSLSVKAAKLEIQKSQEEANKIKDDAHNILEESQRKLKEAEQKVKEIIQQANIEAKQLKEKTYTEATAKAQEEGEVVKEQVRVLMKELFTVKEKALYQAHKEIIQVALNLAGKILRYQAQIDPNVLKAQVVDAIKKATSEADRVQVFVNPANLQLLEESVEDLKKLFPTGVDIVPLTRDSIDLGSCIVETKSGQLDATFSTQLQSLTNLITNLEVKEPEIKIDETIQTPSVEASEIINADQLSIEEELQPLEANEDSLTEEEKLLQEELIGEEPLIDLQEVNESFPFEVKSETKQIAEPQLKDLIEENIFGPQSILQEENIFDLKEDLLESNQDLEIKQEVTIEPESIFNDVEDKIYQLPVHETKEELVIEPEIFIDKEETSLLEDKTQKNEEVSQAKKKFVLDDIPERTREETEELDELPLFDIEDDEENKETIIEEPKLETKSVLRRKKDSISNQGQISEIAKEIEKSSEWKDLIQNDDDE